MQIKANGAADKKSSEDKNEISEPMNGKRSFLDRAKAALNVGRSQEALQRELAERDAREMELYLRKSYYKTASLICDASRSCALLAGHASDSEVAAAAEELWRDAHEAGVSQAGFCLRNMEKQPGKLEKMFEE